MLSQWRDEFTTSEFVSTFASPDHNKVLHDMVRKGLLEKAGRGRYRVTSQKDYVRVRSDISAGYATVRTAGMPYVLTGADAVFFWTKGGFNVDRFFGSYPIWLKVRKEDLRRWKSFFRSQGRKWMVDGRRVEETLFGVFYVLRSVDRVQGEEVDGYSVEPLGETVRFCRENIYAYEPALEMLDEMYGLNLDVKYREFSMPSQGRWYERDSRSSHG